MNIYRCWYNGISGFAGRQDRDNWLFVPDLGQRDPGIHRRLHFSELVFSNRHEHEYELELQSHSRFSFSSLIRNLLFPLQLAATTAGELLLPSGK